MKDLNIDLGEKIEPLANPALADTSPGKAVKHYPSLYLSGKEVEGLPDEGQLLITYCIRRQTTTTDDKGKNTSVDLEVRSIDGVEADEDDEKQTPSDEFESRMKEHLASKDDGDGDED